MHEPTARDWRYWLLSGLTAAAVITVLLLPPIAQDPAYHLFADRRAFLGIPNFWNVASNLPFVIIGVLGLHSLSGEVRLPGTLSGLDPAYRAFFWGFVSIGLGSGYYHLAPTSVTLFWDRLPMTVSFMAFFAVILGEHLSQPLGRKLLWPLLALGAGSVLYWYATELGGHGDLRLYGLVQFLPMLLIPFILVLFPSKMSGTGYLWGVLGTYGLAKCAELGDSALFDGIGLSGHALKHLVAAGGGYSFWLGLRNRRPAQAS
jgi:hypothetical protein